MIRGEQYRSRELEIEYVLIIDGFGFAPGERGKTPLLGYPRLRLYYAPKKHL